MNVYSDEVLRLTLDLEHLSEDLLRYGLVYASLHVDEAVIQLRYAALARKEDR